MKVSPPRRKPQQSSKTLYCIYCNEELGADPARCVYCGASRSNPLLATSTVRHDVPDPFVRFAPKPISNRRKAFALIVGLAAPSLSHRLVGFRVNIVSFTVVCVCALLIALGTAWARRENRIEWPVFFWVAEKLIFAAVAIDEWILLAQPRVSEVRTCYGSCAGSIGGVPEVALAAAGSAVLAMVAVVAVLLMMRVRADARLAAARGQARVNHSHPSGTSQRIPGAAWGSLPGNERWSAARQEEARARRW